MAGKLGAPMLEGEFLMELRRLKLDWSLINGGKIRGHQRPGGMFETWLVYVCPICAVANVTMGTHLKDGYVPAAYALGLPVAEAKAIADAADHAAGHDELMRRRLLEACGLVTKKP